MTNKQTDFSSFLSRSNIDLKKHADGTELRASSSFFFGTLSFELNSTIDAHQKSRRTSRAVLKAGKKTVFDKIVSTDGAVAKVHTTYGDATEGIRQSFYLVERATDAIFVTGVVDGHKIIPLRLDGIVVQPCSLDIQLFALSATKEVRPVEYTFNIGDRAQFSGLERIIDAKSTEFRTSASVMEAHGVTEAECYKCWKDFYCCIEGGKSEARCDALLAICNLGCTIGHVSGGLLSR